MSNSSEMKRSSSSLIILFLVFVFVVLALFLILYGAYVYDNIRNRVDDDFTRRMSVSYITNKIRASDVRGGVEVGDDNRSILLCSNPEGAEALYTYIYHYNGSIMEYITEDPAEFDAAEGEPVMAADSFDVHMISSGLAVRVETNGEDISYTVSLKCA